jgi:hypothetical protein
MSIDTPLCPTTSMHLGWNHNHRYDTRFHSKFIANQANFTPTFHDTTFENYLSSHDIRPFSSPSCYKTISTSNLQSSFSKDVLHYGAMHTDPDCHLFELDMQWEITDLLATNSVEIVPRSTVPPHNKLLQAIWSFHRKRAPDWSILKHNACLCPHGGMQVKGINFWESYAPVVSWHTTCLILVLSLLSSLKSRQVDYISAYTQAPFDCELFMNIPPGFIVDHNTLIFTSSSTRGNSIDYILKLNKNIYGLH